MFAKTQNSRKGAILRIVATALSCACLTVMFPLDKLARRSLADTKQYATVIVDSANVRNAPGTVNTATIDVLRHGGRVVVGDVVTVQNDPSGYNKWCAVMYSNGSGKVFNGYIVDSFLAKDVDPAADPDFENEIAAFPENYKIYLRGLHKNHPNWHFRPIEVAKSFPDTVNNQTRLGVSLIENTVNDAWKSTEPGAYDWQTGTFTPYDGKIWVNASKSVVQHYLDPRNMLTEDTIFQFMELSYNQQYHTMETVQGLLNGTFMQSATIATIDNVQISYAQTFMLAAEKSGANPVFLAAKVLQEVSANGSNSTSGNYYSAHYKKQYTGLYNYFNIGASSDADPVAKGLAFARDGYRDASGNPNKSKNESMYLPWTSPYRSIMGGSIFVANSYINVGQNTIYQMKFNVAPSDASQFGNHQYMTNIQGASSEAKKMYKAYSTAGILDSEISFVIPVYKDLPDSPCLLPRQSGNPNNYLKTLDINGFVLTPQFDPLNCDDYDLVVPATCSSLQITAVPASDKAKVSGTGKVPIGEGVNVVAITVTAENGTSKIYTINVARNTKTYDNLFTTSLANDSTFFGGIAPGTTVADVKAMFQIADGYTLTYVNMNGLEKKDTDTVCSGDLLEINDASGKPAYIGAVFIRGDANCDGKISSADLTMICRYVLGEGSLSEAGKYAADGNKDGKISAADLTKICKHILQETVLEQ